MNHSTTPWKVGSDSNVINDADGNIVCQFFVRTAKKDLTFPNKEINSGRIVSCVNAMNGVEHPEKYVKQTDIVIKSLNQDVKELKELLEDLNNIWNKGEAIQATSLLAKAVDYYLKK